MRRIIGRLVAVGAIGVGAVGTGVGHGTAVEASSWQCEGADVMPPGAEGCFKAYGDYFRVCDIEPDESPTTDAWARLRRPGRPPVGRIIYTLRTTADGCKQRSNANQDLQEGATFRLTVCTVPKGQPQSERGGCDWRWVTNDNDI